MSRLARSPYAIQMHTQTLHANASGFTPTSMPRAVDGNGNDRRDNTYSVRCFIFIYRKFDVTATFLSTAIAD